MRNWIPAAALSAALLATPAVTLFSTPAVALSLGPAEFFASRQMACVLAQESLGTLSEEEYGALTHTVLDEFDETERDTIIAEALGYYDGLMFQVEGADAGLVTLRLEAFVASDTCRSTSLRQPVGLSI